MEGSYGAVIFFTPTQTSTPLCIIFTLHSSKYGKKSRGRVYTVGGVRGSHGANFVLEQLWLAKFESGWKVKRFLARAISKISEFLSLGRMCCILTCGNMLAKSSLSSPSQISLFLFAVFLDSVELEELREFDGTPLIILKSVIWIAAIELWSKHIH